jgi:SPX domain protein involved in polyphosphate accumulation
VKILDPNINPGEEFRFERKFVSELPAKDVESLLKLHPQLFREIYHRRRVNNIYLDTFDLDCFNRTVDGLADRVKVRIRWYGDELSVAHDPKLEIKTKRGLMGQKLSYPLPDFPIDANLTQSFIHKLVEDSTVPELIRAEIKSLQCVLLNSYERKYFLSDDKDFRVTIDTDLDFYPFSHQVIDLNAGSHDRDRSVVELKYDCELDDEASRISGGFPFRLSKNSKYEQGVFRLHG